MKRANTAPVTTPVEAPSSLVLPEEPGIVREVLGGITREDLVLVVQQELEDDLAKRGAETKARLANLDAEVQAIGAKLEAVGPTLTKTVNTKADEALVKALAAAGYTKDGRGAEVKIGDPSRNDEKREYTVEVAIVWKSADGKRSYSHDEVASREVTIKFPAEASRLLTELAGVRKAIADAQNVAMAIRKEVSDIPAKAKRLRAELAKASIARDVNGPKLLDHLRGVGGLKRLTAG